MRNQLKIITAVSSLDLNTKTQILASEFAITHHTAKIESSAPNLESYSEEPPAPRDELMSCCQWRSTSLASLL